MQCCFCSAGEGRLKWLSGHWNSPVALSWLLSCATTDESNRLRSRAVSGESLWRQLFVYYFWLRLLWQRQSAFVSALVRIELQHELTSLSYLLQLSSRWVRKYPFSFYNLTKSDWKLKIIPLRTWSCFEWRNVRFLNSFLFNAIFRTKGQGNCDTTIINSSS